MNTLDNVGIETSDSTATEVEVNTGGTHIKYPSIEQFRSAVKHVRDRSNYHSTPLPKLLFRGTIKAHGTNASIAHDGDEVWHQSRERRITPESDNAGFSQYATYHRDYFNGVVTRARKALGLDSTTKLAIYGEWCGGNIQKGVALSELEKMFVVFGISAGTEDRTWATVDQRLEALGSKGVANGHKVYDITEFPSFEMEIDFTNPELVQNELVRITTEVENECPIGKYFNVSGIGEGVVWGCVPRNEEEQVYAGMRFKVKGEKHSVSKVTKLASVNPEKVASITAFVENTVTENRLQQMRDKLVEMELDPTDMKNIGTFIQYVNRDIIKEESDTLEASGLATKDIGGKVASLARNWYMTKLGA